MKFKQAVSDTVDVVKNRNIFNITWERAKAPLMYGLGIAAATFLVGFFGVLDPVDFFANLNEPTVVDALVAGVNKVWNTFYAAIIPIFTEWARWDKK